uniref:LAGLIDADG endonuclease n=1 Tax=Elmerina hispida TaxID=1245649 RepID=UPI0030034AEF|nr:LAGLIDADG endonuclease [Elmerina hispida]
MRGKKFYSVSFQTRQLDCLNEILNLMYIFKEGKYVKTIKAELFLYMNYIVLAHLIMGSKNFYKNNNLYLKLDSFNILDLVKLINIIKIKYDINCTLITKKNSSLICISNKEIKRLFLILDPYFYDFYKIDKTFIRLAPPSTKNKIKGARHSNKGTNIDLKPSIQIRSFGSYSILPNNINYGFAAPAQDNNDYVNTLHPWFITGFCDAEGSFNIKVIPNTKLKLGYSVYSSFQLTLHSKDKNLLSLIQSFFGARSEKR